MSRLILCWMVTNGKFPSRDFSHFSMDRSLKTSRVCNNIIIMHRFTPLAVESQGFILIGWARSRYHTVTNIQLTFMVQWIHCPCFTSQVYNGEFSSVTSWFPLLFAYISMHLGMRRFPGSCWMSEMDSQVNWWKDERFSSTASIYHSLYFPENSELPILYGEP